MSGINVSRRELAARRRTWEKLLLAAERLDVAQYPVIAATLVASAVSWGGIMRFVDAIAVKRGEEARQAFLSYVWDELRDALSLGPGEPRK